MTSRWEEAWREMDEIRAWCDERSPMPGVPQEALALWACDITQIAPIILNTIEVERMKWEDNPQIKRGEVPPETITLSMFEACLRALIDTDTLPRLEARDARMKAGLADRIEELEKEVKNLRKALEIYERERNRFRHAHPEMTGDYFLAGGYGDKDENGVPMYVEICPAYGCTWTYVYEKTDKTISYEGS